MSSSESVCSYSKGSATEDAVDACGWKRDLRLKAMMSYPNGSRTMTIYIYIYIKGRSRYKEATHKRALWEAKAKSMGLECAALKTWYESIRTKIGKITDTKSGYKDIDRMREVPEGEVQLPGGSHRPSAF